MFEEIKYINSKGASVVFGAYPYFINENDMHSYEWSYDSDNGKITQIKRGISKKSLPVRIACKTPAQGIEYKNELYEVLDYDLLTGSMGKLYIGEYYLNCCISTSKKTNYSFLNNYMALELTVLSEDGAWNRQYTQIFSGEQNDKGSGELLDNNGKNNHVPWFDIPFEFVGEIGGGGKFNNPSIINSEFILRVFGVCSNPKIYIDGHEYSVNVNIGDNEYMEINSKDKTVYKIYSGGEKINIYNARNKKSNVFQKLAPGLLEVQWSGNYRFELISCIERSEPEWI